MQKVTIIIAAYNAEKTIARAVSSALEQTCAPDIIIVDDASSDDTAAVVENMVNGNPRARLLIQSVNQGPSAARNRAIASSKTEWVTPLDADDAMEPERLERMLAIANAEAWDAIADDQYRISSWAEGATRRRLWSDNDFEKIELNLSIFVRENIEHYSGFGRELGFIKPIIRRDFLKKHSLAYDESMRLGEDYDLYARMLEHNCRFGLVDPQGYLAFDTPGSLSRAHGSETLQRLVQSDRRLLANTDLETQTRGLIKEHLRFNQKKVAIAKFGEAFRERDIRKALSSFIGPPSVIGDLIANLFSIARKKIRRMDRV
ncbi:MAG: glycosyltransferase family 2 protein [Pseudomonadota bacterium]